MRDATPEEARQISESDRRAFGYTYNLCQSIPPQHNPYRASNGRTYCTVCGEDITEQGAR